MNEFMKKIFDRKLIKRTCLTFLTFVRNIVENCVNIVFMFMSDYRGAPPHVSEGSAAPLLCANVYESVENEMVNTLIC